MARRSKKEIAEIKQMRADGRTFQEIADAYGVSRQYIQQLCKAKEWHSNEKIVYTNLREYMQVNRISYRDLGISLGYPETSASTNAENLLYGKTEMTVNAIQKLKELTGLSYEKIIKKDR